MTAAGRAGNAAGGTASGQEVKDGRKRVSGHPWPGRIGRAAPGTRSLRVAQSEAEVMETVGPPLQEPAGVKVSRDRKLMRHGVGGTHQGPGVRPNSQREAEYMSAIDPPIAEANHAVAMRGGPYVTSRLNRGTVGGGVVGVIHGLSTVPIPD